jgi:mannonate dehydratase
VKTGFHGATDLSPITMACALHFDLAIHNFGIQEHMPHSALMESIFKIPYHFEDGYMHPGEVPGHGADIDEKEAAKHPYKRAYLPVNRLEQGGAMTNW